MDQAVISASNFLLTVLLFRLLGLEQFGIYSIFFVILIIVQVVHHSTINQPMMSILPKVEAVDERKILAGRFALFHLFINIFFSLLGVGFFYLFVADKFEGSLLPAFLVLILMQTNEFIRRFLFSSSLEMWAFIIDIIRYGGFVNLCLGALFMFSQKINVVFVLWFFALSLAVPFLLSIPISVKHIKFTLQGFFRWLTNIASTSAWLGFSGALQTLSNNLYSLMAGAILGPSAVGMIRASQSITSALPILHQGLETYVPVRAANIYQSIGNAELVRFLRKGFFYSLIFIIIIGGLVFLYEEPLTRILFTNEIGDLIILIGLFILVAIVELGVGFIRFYFRTLLQVRIVFIASVASALLAISIAYPIILALGTVGAVLGILLSRMLALAVFIVAALNIKRTIVADRGSR